MSCPAAWLHQATKTCLKDVAVMAYSAPSHATSPGLARMLCAAVIVTWNWLTVSARILVLQLGGRNILAGRHRSGAVDPPSQRSRAARWSTDPEAAPARSCPCCASTRAAGPSAWATCAPPCCRSPVVRCARLRCLPTICSLRQFQLFLCCRVGGRSLGNVWRFSSLASSRLVSHYDRLTPTARASPG